MNLKTLDNSINYQAEIVEIKQYRKHENADKLWIITVNNTNVITGNEPKIGDLMMYFPVMSKINKDFLSYINGFSNSDLNNDKSVKGFFTEKGRVKPIKLRGVASEGYLHPIKDINDYFKVTFTKDQVNTTFNKINDVILCDKYIISEKGLSSNTKKEKKPKISRIVDNQFRFHIDTQNLRRNIDKISPEDIISIHYKKHGCVSGNTLIDTLEKGLITIKEIVENRLDYHIKSYDIENNKEVYTSIDDYYFKEDHGEWYEIELEDGRKLEITSNNPVWLPELNCYRQVKNLKIEDILLIS